MMIVEEKNIMKKLERVDSEVHSIMNELRGSKPKMTLKELRRLMKSKVKEDIDTTKVIREMRDKEYDL